MADEPFLVDESDVQIDASGEFVKFIFSRDSGERREVVLRRQWLPALATQIQKNIAPGQAVPIDKGSLQIGANFSLQGFQVRRKSDGGATLTLFVDMPDQGRVVTIPMQMSPADIATLQKMLGLS
jgi:hypothetical protein